MCQESALEFRSQQGHAPGQLPQRDRHVQVSESQQPERDSECLKVYIQRLQKRPRPMTPEKLRRRIAYLLWTVAMRCDA